MNVFTINDHLPDKGPLSKWLNHQVMIILEIDAFYFEPSLLLYLFLWQRSVSIFKSNSGKMKFSNVKLNFMVMVNLLESYHKKLCRDQPQEYGRTNQMTCMPSEDSVQTDQSLRCALFGNVKSVAELSQEVVPGPAPGAEAAAAQSPGATFDELGELSGT